MDLKLGGMVTQADEHVDPAVPETSDWKTRSR